VVAGHKNKDLPDDPAILDQTRDYLPGAHRLLADKPSPRDFYDQMLNHYPDRLNLGPLWYGALFPVTEDEGAADVDAEDVGAGDGPPTGC
jgi:hypothetical protein